MGIKTMWSFFCDARSRLIRAFDNVRPVSEMSPEQQRELDEAHKQLYGDIYSIHMSAILTRRQRHDQQVAGEYGARIINELIAEGWIAEHARQHCEHLIYGHMVQAIAAASRVRL